MALVESNIRMITLRQEDGEKNWRYKEQFTAQARTINVHGGRAGYHPKIYMQHPGEVLRRNNFAILADCSDEEKKRDMKEEAAPARSILPASSSAPSTRRGTAR